MCGLSEGKMRRGSYLLGVVLVDSKSGERFGIGIGVAKASEGSHVLFIFELIGTKSQGMKGEYGSRKQKEEGSNKKDGDDGERAQ